MSLRDLSTAPTGLLGDQFHYVAQSASVYRIDFRILTVVPEVLHLLRDVEDARGSDQIEQERLLILARCRREFRDEGLNGESMRNVRDRAPPADLGVRFSLAVLDADVLDVKGHIDEAHALLERHLVFGIRG